MKKQNEDIEAIKQVAEAWRSGWLAGDADLLLSLYAAEPVLMPQDQPAVAGKSAIRPLYEAVLNEFDFQSEGTVKVQDQQQDGGRDGAANRSQPVGPGRSRTSAAADSDR